MKSLYDISWQVSEKEYRADPALSYSTLEDMREKDSITWINYLTG